MVERFRAFEVPVEEELSALEQADSLLDAVLAAGIILLRDWQGSEDGFVALGRRFGTLEKASPRDPRHEGQLFRVRTRPEDNSAIGRYWHADGFAGTSVPALMTIYHVVQGASRESGTAFIDGCEAWIRLPPALRNRLSESSWMHKSGFRHSFALPHRLFGRPVLSVNLGKIAAISGMDQAEMHETLLELDRALNTIPRYVHGWRPGDILLVDNRRMLHRAPDRVLSERLLWRISVISH